MDARARRLFPLLTGLLLMAACEDPVVRSFEYMASSPVYSTPAMTKDLIIFGSENGEVTALSHNGEFNWKYSTRREVTGAVKVARDMVFFGSTNNVFYALDLAGREVWKTTTLARIKGDPIIIGDTVIFGSYDKHVYARSVTTGREVWTYPDSVAAAVPTPLAPAADQKAADPKAADPKAAPPPAAAPAPPVENTDPGDAFSYSSPVLIGDNVVLGNLDGYLYAVNAKEGTLAWRFKTEGADVKKGITSTVLETPKGLVFGANDGNVYCISKDGTQLLWKFKTGDEVNASAIADAEGNLYVGSVDHKFYALDANGKERWRFELKGPVMGRGALLDNLVLFAGGSGDGSLYAVDRATGKLFWSHTTGGKIETDVVVDGNRAFVGSGDKRLYAFQFNKTKAQ